MKPFSVYVHVPYCARKCPYCDFNVHVVRTIPEERYVEALLREIDARACEGAWRGREVASVFFGGGTPSLFHADTYTRLLARLQERFGIARNAEISWEANPEDLIATARAGSRGGNVNAELARLRSAGVTRISLGAQSFDANALRMLGRMHAPDDIARAVHAARGAGFADISIDLIFAVPGQSLDTWQRDLDHTLELRPTHVSTYGLTYEEGTSLTQRRASKRITPADEELERSMYEIAIDTLSAAGFRHYEISNFARPGHESRHNLTYWSWDDYLGLGAGAHGFAREAAPPGSWGSRYENVRAPEEYMSKSPDAGASCEVLDRRMAMEEFILLGLRRLEGFEEKVFEQTFTESVDESAPALQSLIAAGLLARASGRVRLTREGLLLADSVTARLADVR